jgi:hypothetical protein
MFIRNVGWLFHPFSLLYPRKWNSPYSPAALRTSRRTARSQFGANRIRILSADNFDNGSTESSTPLWNTRTVFFILPASFGHRITERSTSTHSVCPYVRVGPSLSVRLLEIRYCPFSWCMAIVFLLWERHIQSEYVYRSLRMKWP